MGHDMRRQEDLNWLMPAPWELAEKQAPVPGEPALTRLLRARGLEGEQEQRQLFHYSLDDLPDPFLFRDMEAACQLIRRQLDKPSARLLIFGDYDADGLTAAALLSRYFKALGLEPQVLIPDRFDDGYGLSPALIDEISRHRPDLVITVDTGTSSPELVNQLLDQGIDVIVTDHHQAAPDLALHRAPIINPVLPDQGYPFAHLAGAGVALMLTLALDRKGLGPAGDLASLLILAAVGTVADVMPLTGVNRIITGLGLAAFQEAAPEGLKALARLSGEERTLKARDIAFFVAPRLNAAGRMGDVRLALDLLMEEDPVRADRLALKLDELNSQRRQVEQEVFDQALDSLTQSLSFPLSVVIAVGQGWHAGVMGIVSSRLVERFRVPAITLNDEDGLLTGSARSFGRIDLIEAIHSAAPLLDKYGGHQGAAGLTLKAENQEAFRRQITMHMEAIPQKDRQKPFRADIVLTGDQVDAALIRSFDLLEPTGSGFERPVIRMENLLVEGVSRMGEGRHLKLSLRTSDPSMRLLEALLFGRGNEGDFYRQGDRLDVLATPELNVWRDRETVQLRLVDLCPADQDHLNGEAVLAYRQWMSGEDKAGPRGISLSQGLFTGLWQLMEELFGSRPGPVTFVPLRLAWLLSHRYNEEADPLGLLLGLAVFDESGLLRLTDNLDGSFTCVKGDPGKKRPALSDSHLWAELKASGVLVP